MCQDCVKTPSVDVVFLRICQLASRSAPVILPQYRNRISPPAELPVNGRPKQWGGLLENYGSRFRSETARGVRLSRPPAVTVRIILAREQARTGTRDYDLALVLATAAVDRVAPDGARVHRRCFRRTACR